MVPCPTMAPSVVRRQSTTAPPAASIRADPGPIKRRHHKRAFGHRETRSRSGNKKERKVSPALPQPASLFFCQRFHVRLISKMFLPSSTGYFWSFTALIRALTLETWSWLYINVSLDLSLAGWFRGTGRAVGTRELEASLGVRIEGGLGHGATEGRSFGAPSRLVSVPSSFELLRLAPQAR